jgi:hypothetical protein
MSSPPPEVPLPQTVNNRDKHPLPTVVKTYLLPHMSNFQGSASKQVFCRQLSNEVQPQWPAEITEEVLAQADGDTAQAEVLAIAMRALVRQRGSTHRHTRTHFVSPAQQIYWFFTNQARGKMAKSSVGTLSLTSRKTRNKTRKQCFQVLFARELDLTARARQLRARFLRDNPSIAELWDDRRKNKVEFDKSKEKDPTVLVKFQSQALNEAWEAATADQKAKAEDLYKNQQDSHESEEVGEDEEAPTERQR